ncbi:MAG: 3-hydroxyacyl-ACP dehydratase FabZ [Fibrobacteraceae bacterium]|nr:3-hydroxyacyl-ACP dehydratase FabZ [Fibrobacteraceae bacterium]
MKKSDIPGVLYDAEVVHAILPQKFPFAFVDEILEINEGDAENPPSLVGRMHVTGEQDFFKGHFPGNPVMPGVIQIESMAQAATLLTMIAMEDKTKDKRPAFMGVEKCRFRKPVIPPTDIVLKVKLTDLRMARRGIFKYAGEVYIGEELVAEAEFSAAMV